MLHKGRRDFIKKSGAFLFGGYFGNSLLDIKSNFEFGTFPSVGIQLSSITAPMTQDALTTLKQLSSMGYKDVESAGSSKGSYYGYNAKEFRKLVEDSGLKWRAHHAGGAARKIVPQTSNQSQPGSQNSPIVLPNLRNNFQQLVDEAAEGGLEYLVCANTPIESMAEINKSIETFQNTGEACKKAGIKFAYHNHASEFDIIENGKSAYDLILTQTDDDLVKMELDLAWSTKAGKDALALFKERPGRFPLWHIKDISKDLKTICEIGDGVVPFKKILEGHKIAGLEYYFIEQNPTANPMAGIESCYRKFISIVG